MPDRNHDEYSPEMEKKILDFIKTRLPSVPAESKVGTPKDSIGIFHEPDWTKHLKDLRGIADQITPQLITHVEKDGKLVPVKVKGVKLGYNGDLTSNTINITVEYEFVKEDDEA